MLVGLVNKKANILSAEPFVRANNLNNLAIDVITLNQA